MLVGRCELPGQDLFDLVAVRSGSEHLLDVHDRHLVVPVGRGEILVVDPGAEPPDELAQHAGERGTVPVETVVDEPAATQLSHVAGVPRREAMREFVQDDELVEHVRMQVERP